MIVAVLIFVATLACVLVRPFGVGVGFWACLGAGVALLTGVVSTSDVREVFLLTWDASVAFVGIILLSITLERIGFFGWCACRIIALCGGSVRLLFVNSLLLTALVSAFFANDSAALILTPIILNQIRILGLKREFSVFFLLSVGFVADAASLPFVFSNLTNIITAGFFGLGFTEYFQLFWLPFLVAVVASIAVALVVGRGVVTGRFACETKEFVVKDVLLFKFAWGFLALLLVCFFCEIRVSFVAFGGGVLAVLGGALRGAFGLKEALKDAPWGVVFFSLGLFVVVFGLKNSGALDGLAGVVAFLVEKGEAWAVFGVGGLAALLSSVANNLPADLVLNLTLGAEASQKLVAANLVGVNVGTKLTPVGSLATLLWLYVLAKGGVKVGVWEFCKFGLVMTPPVLALTLLALLF